MKFYIADTVLYPSLLSQNLFAQNLISDVSALMRQLSRSSAPLAAQGGGWISYPAMLQNESFRARDGYVWFEPSVLPGGNI